MAKKYLKAEEIVGLWALHNKGLNGLQISKKVGIAHSTASDWVRDIQTMLNGGRVARTKGLNDLKVAIGIIKNNSLSGEVKSEGRRKLLEAIDAYVEEEVRERFNRLNKMLG